MNFPCFVCQKVFLRSQDRTAHLKQKNDAMHQAYVQSELKTLTARFSDTIQAVSARGPSPVTSSLVGLSLVHRNDVDIDDLPSSADMNIEPDDPSSLSDEEGSIVSSWEDGKNDDIVFAAALGAAEGIGLNDNEAKFDFLPDPVFDPDVEWEDISSTPSTAAHHQGRLGRVLDDDESEPHTWHWHPSGGKVIRHEESAYKRWQKLFTGGGDELKRGYQPFLSRLDWEISQWAVQNRIGQGAFNRLLRIPQVQSKTLCKTCILNQSVGEEPTGSVFHQCTIDAATS